MSDTMIELKPCPFCGSPAHIVELMIEDERLKKEQSDEHQT